MAKRVNILSIDGGGIYGIISALILSEIEKLTKKPISSLFDLIAGTSTGGILALGLTRPDSSGKNPKYTAEDGVELYEKKSDKIFARSFFHKIRALGNLIDEKYPPAGEDKVFASYFEDSLLSEALTNVLVTSYDIERRNPHFFKSIKANISPDRDFYMKDVARATSAAPTFFEPAHIINKNKDKTFSLVDGGVFANNPAMTAYVEAKTLFPEDSPFFILSIGTGGTIKPYLYEKAKNWGAAQWAGPIMDILFDGIGDTVDYELGNMFPKELKSENKYERLVVDVSQANGKFDDVSPENIKFLKSLGEEFINKNTSLLESTCKELS